jgi:predicted transcriptional regulator
MKKTQTSLLLELAKKLKKENSSKETALKSLFAAGIVTEDGQISNSFPNLKRVLSEH